MKKPTPPLRKPPKKGAARKDTMRIRRFYYEGHTFELRRINKITGEWWLDCVDAEPARGGRLPRVQYPTTEMVSIQAGRKMKLAVFAYHDDADWHRLTFYELYPTTPTKERD